MLDINGQELDERDLVQLLCEVVSIDEEGIRVRILNSEQELLVSVQRDEVLGLHASPELTKFEGQTPAPLSDDSQADGVKLWPME